MKKKEFIALGLMSGTSMDGVDISLIKSDGKDQFSCILNDYCQFNDKLREKIINLRTKINSFQDLESQKGELKTTEREITIFHNEIINKISNNFNGEIDLIGFHGQTIFHNPIKKITKQLGNGSLLSQLTKRIVVNNFRQGDINNGGQGAPLVPIFHRLISLIMRENKKLEYPALFMNIGGITNITKLINGDKIDNNNFFAYDIGPGNCLIDEWVRKNSKYKYDSSGNFAQSGKVDHLILNQVIDNFNIDNFDKSLDIKDFDTSFARGLSFEDGCATITTFTAYLIAKGIEKILKIKNDKIISCFISGGGRKNMFLMNNIKNFLSTKKIKLENIDNYDFNGDFIESQAFGYLAIRAYLGEPISFPNTTRCKSPSTGGVINKNF